MLKGHKSQRSKSSQTALRLRNLGLLTLAVIGGQFARAEPAATAPTARILEMQNDAGTDKQMFLREVTLAPGASVPLHHHTVAGLVFIVEGVAESAYGSEAPRLYHVGETMQDRADIPHTLFRNSDPNKPLRFLTFYTAAQGQPYLVTP